MTYDYIDGYKRNDTQYISTNIYPIQQLKMNTKLIILILLAVCTQSRQTDRRRTDPTCPTRSSKLQCLRAHFCNSQTCEKCEIEVRRHHTVTRMGRMCKMILRIKNCCAIHATANNILSRDMR